MAHQITKKLDFEKGRRREKTAAPDYLEELREQGSTRDPGGKDGDTRITLRNVFSSAVGVAYWREQKQNAFTTYQNNLRKMPVRIGAYTFRLKDSLAEFADSNNLSL